MCHLLLAAPLHSILQNPESRRLDQLQGLLSWTPTKFLLLLPLALLVVGYAGVIAFEWSVSPLRYDVNPAWMYGLGYAPILLIILVFEVYGYIDRNEDRVLLDQRRERGRLHDMELGIHGSKKPSWWSKRGGADGRTSHFMTPR